MTGQWLEGRYVLKILDVRNFGHPDSGDGSDGTDRYFAEVICAPKGSNIKPLEKVSVKFKNHGFPPQDKRKHQYYGNIGEFDGADNDIQDFPQENIKLNRKGCTWKNPFEKKYRAMDCTGKLVNPEDVDYGIYFCLKCAKIVRWRVIDGKPQFYHWPRYNPDCPWSSTSDSGWDNEGMRKDLDYNKIWSDAFNNLYEYGLLYLLKGQEIVISHIENYIIENSDETNPAVIELKKILIELKPVIPSEPIPVWTKPPRDRYIELVKNNGLELANVPDEYRDKEMCQTAVKKNLRALQFVPGKLLDKEMYLMALKNNPLNIKYFWDILSFEKIYEIALEVNKQLAIFYHDVEHHITWAYDQIKYGRKR